MRGTDAMLARLQAEIEEKKILMDGIVEAAENGGRDMTPDEMEMYNRCRDRMRVIEGMMEPLRDGARIVSDSQRRTAELQEQYVRARNPQAFGTVEYRTAGAYIADMYLSRLGDHDAEQRQETYHRVAAHQTTADNPGLLPESIVGPLVSFVDQTRPLVSAIGPTDLGSGSWAYARVTQHTQVGVQAGEKTELASRKMTITKTPITGATHGGYVNVSKQDINRTSPAILDMVLNDLAGQYSADTEATTATALTTAAQVGPIIPANPTAQNINTALWGAAGTVFAATKGQGRTVVAMSPDQLGIIGPIFPNVNPQNAFSTGFDASSLQTGVVGVVSGLTVIMSAGFAADTIIVFSSAAVRAFEYKYGNLQVVEPSVWGVQVGYAGDFEAVVVEPNAVVRVTTA